MGLNLSRGDAIKYYSSDRITQIIGNGLVCLIDEKTQYQNFFNNDEMVFYKSVNDLSEKIIQISSDEKLRKKIVRKGKLKYMKYFNSDVISKFIINKTLDLKDNSKYLWVNEKSFNYRYNRTRWILFSRIPFKKITRFMVLFRRVALEDETHRLWRIKHLINKINLTSASLESYASIVKIIQKVKPDEIYHLAAQSYVGYSFQDEFSTLNTNINGTHYMLAATRNFTKIKNLFCCFI